LLIANNVDMLNKGNIAEAFAGLEMIKYANAYEKKPVYYWHREKRGSSPVRRSLKQNSIIEFIL